MPGESTLPEAQSTGSRVRGRIIVARDQPYLWQSLREHFAANGDVEILLDRRLWERRQRIQTCEPEQRQADRRQPQTIENDLRRRSFLIVTR